MIEFLHPIVCAMFINDQIWVINYYLPTIISWILTKITWDKISFKVFIG